MNRKSSAGWGFALGCWCVLVLIYLGFIMYGVAQTHFATNDLVNITCLEQRSNPAVHNYCVKQHLDKP